MSGRSGLRRSLAWLALLLAALALIFWQLRHPVAPTVDADDKLGEPLITAPYADWAAIDTLSRGERMHFERDAAGLWWRHDAVAREAADHVHPTDPAAAERIGQVLATFSRARVERSLSSDPARLAAYGLANPALIVLIQGRDDRLLQTIELGDIAPDGLSRYVQLPQTRQVHTIPNYHAIGLLSLLDAPLPPGAAASGAAAP
jgi:hypothetical protein